MMMNLIQMKNRIKKKNDDLNDLSKKKKEFHKNLKIDDGDLNRKKESYYSD